MLVLPSGDYWHIQLTDFVISHHVDLEYNPPGLSQVYINYNQYGHSASYIFEGDKSRLCFFQLGLCLVTWKAEG